jgi:hypothetical protein
MPPVEEKNGRGRNKRHLQLFLLLFTRNRNQLKALSITRAQNYYDLPAKPEQFQGKPDFGGKLEVTVLSDSFSFFQPLFSEDS